MKSFSSSEETVAMPHPEAVKYPDADWKDTTPLESFKEVVCRIDAYERADSDVVSQSEDSIEEPSAKVERLHGRRLVGTTLALMLCVFLANLEIPIVSTSLVAITDDLREFDKSSWIITSYLLTYSGCLMVWAKFSDTLGRRQSICVALTIFTLASIACAAAQTITQLLVFRAFQGVGGSGLLSLSFVVLPEMVAPERYATFAAFPALSFVFGFLLGPIIGGAIADNAMWRWVFIINVPIAFITAVILLLSMPAGFPNLDSKRQVRWSRLKEIDVVGALLAFGMSGFLVSALEEAGSRYAWDSPLVISLFTMSGFCLFGFLAWERVVDSKLSSTQCVLTWRLLRNRVFMSGALITFLAGVPFTVGVISIPQAWQMVNGTSSLTSGFRLLPFTLLFAVGTIIAVSLTSRLRVPTVFIVIAGSSLQIVGTCLQSVSYFHDGPVKYLAEALMGSGLGANVSVVIQMTPELVRGRDQAAAMGTVTQTRALGSVVGFAIGTNVLNEYTKHHLSSFLQPRQIALLGMSVTNGLHALPADLQAQVRAVFSDAYELQMKVLVGFAVAQLLAVALMWERKLRRVN